jgi:hypothetical protein
LEEKDNLRDLNSKCWKIKVYYSPMNVQAIVLKTILKFYIKIALTCFGAVTLSSGSSLSVLAKVTVLM